MNLVVQIPMYVAVIGISLALDSPWSLLAIPFTSALVYLIHKANR